MKRAFEKGVSLEEDVLMSSDEDVPAPSPSAAVVARRAGREAKSMREESGSDKDAEEPEECGTTTARPPQTRAKEEILARNSTYYWFYRSSLQVRPLFFSFSFCFLKKLQFTKKWGFGEQKNRK